MNDLDKFIDAIMCHIAKQCKIPAWMLLRPFETNSAIIFQRHYTQAGPWADMIREGV